METVIVTGDFMIDRYIIGTSDRISPEAPVPVMKITEKFDRVGGAGNVALNMRVPCKLAENDNQGLIIKTRYICNGQQVLRIDQEGYKQDQVQIPKCDYLIVSDYNKGNIVDFEYMRKNSIFQFVDAKKHFEEYYAATVVKCNESEYAKFCPYPLTEAGMRQACKTYRIRCLIVTRAHKPIMFTIDEIYEEVEVPAVEVRDVTGAGDVFLAILASRLILGDAFLDAIKAAAKAASISCKHFGTYKLTDEEYESCLH